MKSHAAGVRTVLAAGSPILLSTLLFAGILAFKIPLWLSDLIGNYSPVSFCLVLLASYLAFRRGGRAGLLAGLCLSMALCALVLSHKWSSGYSDNMLIGGLMPYKDAKNFFVGAELILDGSPLVSRQATWRPVFPSLLSTLQLLTGANLRASLGILAGLAALVMYFTARRVGQQFGALPAAVFFTLIYFYAYRFVGYTLSELPGLLLGCLGFVLLWQAAIHKRWLDLGLGIFTLMAAVSARAGAFLVFPFLALWAGWIYRGAQRFSYRAAGGAAALVLVSYLFINNLFPALVGVPSGTAFSNLAHALYGQVQGGTGWHRAIVDLGDVDPSLVYRAAWVSFLDHPLSLLIGIAKSYRDLFLSGHNSFFQFHPVELVFPFEVLTWVAGTLLLVVGLARAARNPGHESAALFLAGFAGVFVSIPFLPPVDGGFRFYAATMPFVYVLPALSAAALGRGWRWPEADSAPATVSAWRAGATAVLLAALALPVLTHALSRAPSEPAPVCPDGQVPFAFEARRGSYVDIVTDRQSACGQAPRVCLADFEAHAYEKHVDDFAQLLIERARADPHMVRLTPAGNLASDNLFHYFMQPSALIGSEPQGQVVAGCAIEIDTSKARLYLVDSLVDETPETSP